MAAAAEPALVKRAFLDSKVRTLAFVYVFVAYAYIQPAGYRSTYPDLADRLAVARTFGQNAGLRLLYGDPHEVQTVSGYAAWRAGGTLAIAAAIFGLLAAVRALRGDEEAGRLELVLSLPVGRRTVNVAALGAVGLGIVLLWLAEWVGFVAGGLPVGGSAYLALATATVAVVCAALGALVSQLAPTRRLALELGFALVGGLLLLRILADTVDGLGVLRWLTPLGWAEELRPFTGAQPVVLVLPLVASVVLTAVAARIAAGRDIGTGLLPARDSADPRYALLSSPTAHALREARGVVLAWAGGCAVFGYILGIVSKSVSPADISRDVQDRIARLGTGSIVTPTGYLAFVFLLYALALSVFACTQVGQARQEEADGRLETLLALPVDRRAWLAGRLVLAFGLAAAVVLAIAVATWAGAASAGAHVSLWRLLEAAANCLPVTLLFLGLAGLAYAVLPRAASAIAYTLVAVSFLWQLVGALLDAPGWLLELTPFAHVSLVPQQPCDAASASALAAIGVAAGARAGAALRRRDLTS
jgi:ABC-2 type transport system permease protein